MHAGREDPQDSDSYEHFHAEDETMDGMKKVRGYHSSSPYRLATGILGLLCAALLMGVIGMAVRIKRMDTTQSSLNITALKSELEHLRRNHIRLTAAKVALQQDYNKARGDRSVLQAQVEREKAMYDRLLSQLQSREEKIKGESLRVAQLERSCGRCPPGWELVNDTCYYFSAPNTIGRKGWHDARADCVRQGADLVIVDTEQKQEQVRLKGWDDARADCIRHQGADLVQVVTEQKQAFITGVLKALHSEGYSYRSGYWIGLREIVKEGTWHWISEVLLDTGYWMDGEPNDGNENDDCAATYPTINPMKSWNDAPCRYPLKWICEKEVTGTS